MTHDEMKKSTWVCVLADDETYTGLDGCWIAPITEEQIEHEHENDICDLPEPHHSLQALLEWAIDHGYFDCDPPPA